MFKYAKNDGFDIYITIKMWVRGVCGGVINVDSFNEAGNRANSQQKINEKANTNIYNTYMDDELAAKQ